ncbi:uncharacterized protein LOC124113559 isoform X1 [Haliotis rufescens]|uniref:uncharacterized protein LOC124113559 isoform X1 n=1 Tax=Haliotis rufescens TaxID=6454 RepID=UPI00201ED404|nr:uncharacterized protein LOC124113559 isoform X1 [Haliotis rufescens]
MCLLTVVWFASSVYLCFAVTRPPLKKLLGLTDQSGRHEKPRISANQLTRQPESIRNKRSVHLQGLANKDWKVSWTSPTPKVGTDSYDVDDFQVINQEEILRAKHLYMKNILTYVGITLGAVFLFVIIAFCFLVNPKQCIIAFGTGSPCCLIISPCILKCVEKFLDPGKIVQGQMNRYVPGVVIDETGKVAETYEPTPEELQALQELVEEVMEMV